MKFILSPKVSSSHINFSFPATAFKKTFSVKHPNTALALFSSEEPFAHSESLFKILRSRDREFVQDIEQQIRRIVSLGDQPFYDSALSSECQELVLAVTVAEGASTPAFLRLLWIPLSKTLKVLFISLEEEKGPYPECSDISLFRDVLISTIDEWEKESVLRGFAERMSSVIGNPDGSHEFYRFTPQKVGTDILVKEQFYSSDMLRHERISGEKTVPSFCHRIKVIKLENSALSTKTEMDRHFALLKTRFHLGMFLGGIFCGGILSISGAEYNRIGTKVVGMAIKDAELFLSGMFFVSEHFALMQHWSSETLSFPEEVLPQLMMAFQSKEESTQPPLVIKTQKLTSGVASKIWSRIRLNDSLVKCTDGKGMILLRHCCREESVISKIIEDLHKLGIQAEKPELVETT